MVIILQTMFVAPINQIRKTISKKTIVNENFEMRKNLMLKKMAK